MSKAKRRLLEKYTKESCLQLTQKELAHGLNITQGRASSLLKEVGWKSKGFHQTETRIERMEAVLAYVEENGGIVQDAIDELGIRIQGQEVRNYAKQIGFDLSMYRNAYQRYGLWMVLPSIPKPMYTADWQVDAICLGCNTKHKLLLTNARGGVSTGCKYCSQKNKKTYQVKCVQTGDSYRSIRAFVKAIGKMNSYQSYRIKLLKRGEIEFDGSLYVLSEESSNI